MYFTIFLYALLPTIFSPYFILFYFILFFKKIISSFTKFLTVNKFSFLFFLFVPIVHFFISLVNGGQGKDLVEIYRVLLIGMGFFIGWRLNSKKILYFFVFFCIISLIFSFFQLVFYDSYLVSLIMPHYVNQDIIDQLFQTGDIRVSGFNEGPAHFGILMIFFIIVSICLKKAGDLPVKYFLIFVGVAVLGMFFAKAKSTIPLLFFLFGWKFFIVGFLFILFFIYIYYDFFTSFFYMDSLYGRFDIWRDLSSYLYDKPWLVMSGLSRDMLAGGGAIFDSDFILLFLTKGIFLFFIFYFLFFISILKSKSPLRKVHVFVIVACGLANPALLDVKFGFVYAVVFSALLNLNNREKSIL